MILIADSGSTKTTWALVETGNKVVTEGLNPHFSSDEQILAAYAVVCDQFKIQNSEFTIYFYGAGCGDMQQAKRMKALLQEGFNTDNVSVETDMLGACRAVSSNGRALVGILGTGSNACYYDGKDIAYCSPSLGYILGDEGSANHLGRKLVDNYLKGKMSTELSNMFNKTFPYSYAEWMDHIYHQSNANRFLASLARFAVDHSDIDECKNDILYVIDLWHREQLSRLITQSHCSKIHVVGSFGKAIETLLRQSLTTYGMEVGTVVADPIDGLIQFHRTL